MMQKEQSGEMIKAGHRELYVTQKGKGQPVVLLHGGGPGANGLSNFSRNIDQLAEHFHVIVPDMPGYGGSSKSLDRNDPFGSLAEALSELLKTMGIDSAHLVGNSYGGACALRLALDSPEQVKSLVLMGPGGIGTTRALPTKGLSNLLGYYGGSGPSREKLEEFIREYLVYDGAAVPNDVIDIRYQASIDPEVVANPPLSRPSGPFALRTLWRMDLTRDKRLKQTQVPTLVVWGAEDKVNRPSGGQLLRQLMTNCQLMQVEQAGHWVQWEKADLFNETVIDFLRGKN